MKNWRKRQAEEGYTHKSKKIITKINHLTDWKNHITLTLRIDGDEKEFIVDTVSPATKPLDKQIFKDKKKLLVTRKYQDVNENEVITNGKITVEAESKGIRKNLSMLITEREDIKLLLGMDWLRECNWMIQIEKTITLTDQSETNEKKTQFQSYSGPTEQIKIRRLK